MFVERLKNTNLFINNTYFKKYIQLIQDNLETKRQPFKTQRHHIIPLVAFKLYNLPGKDAADNIVNLLYKDHILAHYYLALCSKSVEFRYKMLCAINFILGKAAQVKLDVEELKNMILDLDEYQKLYEECKKIFGDQTKGKTHCTSELTKEKIGKANKGRIYINKDGVVKAVQPADLNLFLESGWTCGNPNCTKRNLHKGDTIMNKDGIEKYVKIDDINKYISEGWKQGLSDNHIIATKKGTQAYYDKLTDEEKIKKCASYGMLGKKHTKESVEKISLKLSGRKCSEKQKLQNSLNKRNTIHMTNGVVNRMIKPELEQELLEQGFWRGRTMKKKK